MIAGVDEAGRGPLAGPVVAAAVILDARHLPQGLADSKQLSAARRERLYGDIVRSAIWWAVGQASVEEIDGLNILRATLLAMQRAVDALGAAPAEVLVDGKHTPRVSCRTEAIVKGDSSVPCIMAASIVAKVTRDRLMVELDASYPEYGFARHSGYPTADHLAALRRHGPCPAHRRSFRPVKQLLGNAS